MVTEIVHASKDTIQTQGLKTFIHSLGIDLVGIANIQQLDGMPTGISSASTVLLENFRYAVVLGAQLNRLGRKATGSDVSLFMEKAAIDVLNYFLRCFSRWLYCW